MDKDEYRVTQKKYKNKFIFIFFIIIMFLSISKYLFFEIIANICKSSNDILRSIC